jgi:hypothetical protein
MTLSIIQETRTPDQDQKTAIIEIIEEVQKIEQEEDQKEKKAPKGAIMMMIVKDQEGAVTIINMNHAIKVTDPNLDQDQETAIIAAIEEGAQKIEQTEDQKEKKVLEGAKVQVLNMVTCKLKKREILRGHTKRETIDQSRDLGPKIEEEIIIITIITAQEMMTKEEIQGLITIEQIIIKGGMIPHTQQTEEGIKNHITPSLGNMALKHQLRTIHLGLPL